MSGFNLPPGCSVNDLPGNSSEEVRFEKLVDWLIECGLDTSDIRNAVIGRLKQRRNQMKIRMKKPNAEIASLWKIQSERFIAAIEKGSKI